jgi:hypothetical protein
MDGRWTLEGSGYGFRCPLLREGAPLAPGEVVPVVPCDEAAVLRGTLALTATSNVALRDIDAVVRAVLRAAGSTS